MLDLLLRSILERFVVLVEFLELLLQLGKLRDISEAKSLPLLFYEILFIYSKRMHKNDDLSIEIPLCESSTLNHI